MLLKIIWRPLSGKFEDTERQAETINQRWTDNTMANRKGTKGQTTIVKAVHRKQRIGKNKLFQYLRINWYNIVLCLMRGISAIIISITVLKNKGDKEPE